MPRKTSLIAAITAAFAVAIPTAAAEGQPAGIYRAGVYSAPQSGTTPMLDARERGLGGASTTPVDARSDGLNRLYGLGEYANPIDARERGLVEKSQTKPEQPMSGFNARSDGMNRIYGLGEYAPVVVADDRFRIGPASAPVLATPSPGTDIEWPQVGIGLGLGIAFVLVLLAMKATRQRPLAH